MPMIAVLDDDRKLWEVYMQVLRESDIEIVQYVNKINFFLEPPRLKPDLIVTDIRSPKMDGYEFLELVRQDPEYRNIPVIVMSGHSETDLAERLRAHRRVSFLQKPFSLAALNACLHRALERLETICGGGGQGICAVIEAVE